MSDKMILKSIWQVLNDEELCAEAMIAEIGELLNNWTVRNGK